MLEKINRLAERTATGASRRQFLGNVGRSAMTLATIVGGLLALPGVAQGNTAPAACGPGSTGSCRGKPVGAGCNVGRYVGRCMQAPNCTCRIISPRPPR